jgi:L-alanine-DL-glutamate epimerase-like enolase superfamily enzyme
LATATRSRSVPIERLRVAAYELPADEPESDGTLEWASTTIVTVFVRAGDETGLGYTYGDRSVASFVASMLADAVEGLDALSVGQAWSVMQERIRNAGRPGAGAMAVSAVDAALWDLKARLLDLPVATLLGTVRDEVPIYASGGFTSYSVERLRDQLAGWVAAGIPRVKMKVSRNPDEDPSRLDAARDAIGSGSALYVDANGALTRKQALRWAERFASEWEVTWFEEPVSSDDLEGLRLLRDRGPAGLDIAAGEYGWQALDFRRLLEAGAVDCLQADATRCGGITGFLQAAALADAFGIELSAHCAPALHVHPCCAAQRIRHLEYFHDHVRLERLLFDGVAEQRDGALGPDLSRPGLGLELKEADAARYEVG